ncbi:MAG TPA: hypothetical protein VJ323_16675, partial [Bryobacteraceae bacterium]|nr:hypothetical protein [Bryobacteraceae bacterium]
RRKVFDQWLFYRLTMPDDYLCFRIDLKHALAAGAFYFEDIRHSLDRNAFGGTTCAGLLSSV